MNTAPKIQANIPRNEFARLVPNFCIHVSVSGLYIYSHDLSLFCCIAFADRSCEYINHSQIREYRIWDRGRAVSFMGIFVSNFRYSVFAVNVPHTLVGMKHTSFYVKFFVLRKITVGICNYHHYF
jgi:hypothetical protein